MRPAPPCDLAPSPRGAIRSCHQLAEGSGAANNAPVRQRPPTNAKPSTDRGRAVRTGDDIAMRAARADLAAFDRIMSRKGGQPPVPGDEIAAKPRSRPRRKRRAAER